MSTTPLVTVLMPVHNGGVYLSAAVESILQQTYADFELLVIDDGSTDDTPQTLAAYAKADSRVRVVTQASQGLIKTLNAGLELARGELVARMDADDVSLPERLEKQVAFLEQHPQVALLGTACRYFTAAGPTDVVLQFEKSPHRIRERILRVNQFCHPTVMFRKTAVQEVGGYHAAFVHAEDCDLWLRIVERYDAANLDEVLLHYRLHENQTSLKYLRQQSVTALAARWAAQCRRRGQVDPLTSEKVITANMLNTSGVSVAAIERNIIDHHIRWLGTLERVGFASAAAELRRVIRSTGEELGLGRYAAARLLLEDGLSSAMAGRLWRGLKQSTAACWREPRLTSYLLDLVRSRFARYGWKAN